MRMPSDPLDARLCPSNSPPLDPQLTATPQLKEKCPRCDSRDTKFCYYNNYNTSQPRHFCRSCRRYWTLGGSLRNVPIGGSSRKRLRPNPSSNPNLNMLSPTAGSINPSFDCHVSFAPPASMLPLRSFRFDLGLGLWVKNESGPSAATIEELGFGQGPTTLVWPSSFWGEGVARDTWQVESGGQSAVPAQADGSGGLTDSEEVH